MNALETLAAKGFTQDDLVKMASARLFAQECAEEGVDLSKFASADQDRLFDKWVEMKQEAGQEAPKFASAEETVKEAATKEAAAKCAEMEILGRYLAQVFVNETNKLASAAGDVAAEVAKDAPGFGRKAMEWAKDHPKTMATALLGTGAAGGFAGGRMTANKTVTAPKVTTKESQVVVNLNKVANYAKTGLVEGNEKCADALEEAVCSNIYDKLAAGNFDVSCFHETVEVEVEKEASAEEIEAAVDEMAVNTLKNLGYSFGA